MVCAIHAKPVWEKNAGRVERQEFRVDSRVEVIAGPLSGIQGILVEKRGKFRFVVQVDLIQRAISVEIDASDVRPLYSGLAGPLKPK